MPLRKIRLADHRGREATVLLVPRSRPPTVGYADSSNASVRFTRLLKATESTGYAALLSRYGDPDSLARALIDSDPEIDMQATGSESGPCDRVHVGADGKPLYSARMVEVVHDHEGNEIARREPVEVPANLVPDTPPRWSGKLIAKSEAADTTLSRGSTRCAMPTHWSLTSSSAWRNTLKIVTRWRWSVQVRRERDRLFLSATVHP